jgi:hypothetical protein
VVNSKSLRNILVSNEIMKREKERRLTYLLAHFSPVVIAIPSSTFGGGAYLPVDHPQLVFASERVVVTRDAAVADPIEKKNPPGPPLTFASERGGGGVSRWVLVVVVVRKYLKI